MRNTPKTNEPRTRLRSDEAPPGYRRSSKIEKKDLLLPTFSQSAGAFLVEVLKVVIISLAIIIPVRYFLIQPFYVKGASMEPNFHDNEYLIIDEISYRLRTPDRGDVVVLRNPNRPSEFFIKRIIGLPGETVEIENGHVFITNTINPNGKQLDESPYLKKEVVTSGTTDVTLGPEEYIVLGDNRPSSLDSRTFGPIHRSEIIGRTWIRAWPIGRATVFDAVPYGS
jgi:signal peptidase I